LANLSFGRQVITFEQNNSLNRFRDNSEGGPYFPADLMGFPCSLRPGGIMATPKNDKHKEYTRYATHCLHMVTVTRNQESRAIQREMAAEWLKLADAIAHP
jgi:hypothetical protein